METATPIPAFAPVLSELEGEGGAGSEKVLGTEKEGVLAERVLIEGVLVEAMGDVVILLTRLLVETPLEIAETDVPTLVAGCAVRDCGGAA